MAERIRYPQIPSTVWWGVRNILQRSPNVTLDARALAVQLSVQETAAKTYTLELRNVGVIDDEGKATPLAQKWRLDKTYSDAVQELLSKVYPQQLLDIAPPDDANRPQIIDWFMHEGLGRGAAGNKAATYLMIGSASPNEAPIRISSKQAGGERKATGEFEQRGSNNAVNRGTNRKRGAALPDTTKRKMSEQMPLNVNLQIHISADAGSEQIEAIFRAMKHYLYDAENS